MNTNNGKRKRAKREKTSNIGIPACAKFQELGVNHESDEKEERNSSGEDSRATIIRHSVKAQRREGNIGIPDCVKFQELARLTTKATESKKGTIVVVACEAGKNKVT